MRGVNHQVQHLVKRGIDVEQVHARRGHHHIASAHVSHADHTFKHGARLGTNDVVVLRLGQGFDQLVGRVGAGVNELGQFLQKTALVLTVCRKSDKSRGLGI